MALVGHILPHKPGGKSPIVGKNSEARDLPSAELGGRQAAGVLFLGARPAWALAARVKIAPIGLGTLRRMRGHLR